MKNTNLIILLIIALIAIGIAFYVNNKADKNALMGDLVALTGQVMEELVEEKPEIIATEEKILEMEVLEEGEGEAAVKGDKLTVHYVGTFEDGRKFDSSLDRKIPFIFRLGAGQVIKGWDQGAEGMKVGEKRKLVIPPDLGYGEAGNRVIPPNTILIFEIELLEINK